MKAKKSEKAFGERVFSIFEILDKPPFLWYYNGINLWDFGHCRACGDICAGVPCLRNRTCPHCYGICFGDILMPECW